MKAVILAGGTGTRLWPLSRLHKPKQFQKLASGKTLLQEALARLSFLKPNDIYIATNKDFKRVVREQAPRIPLKNILIEPALRDTASCIGFAAAVIAQRHPEEVMAVIYADHLIKDKKEFQKKLKIAERVAQEEQTLNIIEVTAKSPNVNLGYVKVGKKLKTLNGVDVYAFERFIEKPDLSTAKKLLQSPQYLWNTGIYIWKASTILEAYRDHLPNTFKRLKKIQKALGTRDEKKVIAAEYPQMEKISIDYAIMEKVDPKQVRILPADLGWSDIGTWVSLHEELAQESHGNIGYGLHLTLDTEGSIVYNTDSKKMVVALGLKDVAIINTPDAILICDKNQSQKVKQVIEHLKASKHKKLL